MEGIRNRSGCCSRRPQLERKAALATLRNLFMWHQPPPTPPRSPALQTNVQEAELNRNCLESKAHYATAGNSKWLPCERFLSCNAIHKRRTARVAVFAEAVLVHELHCHLHGRLVCHNSHCDWEGPQTQSRTNWEEPQPWLDWVGKIRNRAGLGRSADTAQEQETTDPHIAEQTR